MRPLPYHQPGTVQEALGLARSLPGSRFVAGGTDLLVRLKSGAHRPSALISLRGIPELTGTEIGETARLGAATTVADLQTRNDHYEGILTRVRVATGSLQASLAELNQLATLPAPAAAAPIAAAPAAVVESTPASESAD